MKLGIKITKEDITHHLLLLDQEDSMPADGEYDASFLLNLVFY